MKKYLATVRVGGSTIRTVVFADSDIHARLLLQYQYGMNSIVASPYLTKESHEDDTLVDNIIKPIVLHGQSKLHPLLALLSVLGGVGALGPIGIFVGPIAVAFLQAALTMLQAEIDSLSGGDPAGLAGAAGGGVAQTVDERVKSP